MSEHDESPEGHALAVLEGTDPKESLKDGVPVLYERAKAAIQACVSVDECKYWSNRAAALRTYAEQLHDDTMRLGALRIQARAERKCGAILKETPSGSAANLKQHRQEVPLPSGRQEVPLPSVTRTSVANAAGLTEHERKTALRIASIPERDFEAAVESEKPPTLTELAVLGTAHRPVPPPTPIAPAAPAEVAEVTALLRDLAAFCSVRDALSVACAPDADHEALAAYAEALRQWLDRLMANLSAEAA